MIVHGEYKVDTTLAKPKYQMGVATTLGYSEIAISQSIFMTIYLMEILPLV
jgi:hypothetical protein